MKSIAFVALGLLLLSGTAWSEDGPGDEAAFTLMKLDRVALLQAIGTPLKEVTEARYTSGLWDSIIVQQDKEDHSFYFYFLSKDKVTAFCSVDYFSKDDNRLESELSGLKREVEGQGYQVQKDSPLDGPHDALYFDPKAKEFVGARVVAAADGSSILYGLYTASHEALNPVAKVSADLYDSLK